MSEPNFELFTLTDIARKSGWAHSTVWQHFRDGRLPSPKSKKGRTQYWDAAGYAESIRYFKNRKPFERTTKPTN